MENEVMARDKGKRERGMTIRRTDKWNWKGVTKKAEINKGTDERKETEIMGEETIEIFPR
jgi:hypothetical protein